MENKIELKIVDFRELDEGERFESNNGFEIVIEVKHGLGQIKTGIENGDSTQYFAERDLELDLNTNYLIQYFDAKDNFTGDQQVLTEMIKDVVSDTEADLNQILIDEDEEIAFESGESLEEVISEIENREGWTFDKTLSASADEFSLFFFDGEDHMELIYFKGRFAKQFRHNIHRDILEIDTGVM